MSVENTPEDDFLFSEDPEEQMRIENALLKLKIQAELGASFHEMTDLPPEVERGFLENVLKFEEQFSKSESKTVAEVLGNPVFQPAFEMDDESLEMELSELEDLLEERSIAVDFLADYPARTRYEFITEELFFHEVFILPVDGMTMHFTYEEFHPNHKYDIEQVTDNFMRQWFEREFGEYSFEIADHLVLPGEIVISKGDLLEKLAAVFDSYVKFENEEFFIGNISFQFEEDGTGLGHSEGAVRYDATLESGEVVHFEASYILYMQNINEIWEIFYFDLPGFVW